MRKTVGAEDKTISLKAGAAGKVKFTEIEVAEDVNSQIDYGNATSADVTWTSSDENVAVVENGVIVSKGEGAKSCKRNTFQRKPRSICCNRKTG